ncbi:MAG: hypothetical protein HZC12_00205 [Nitrospirae bacterium]|nr:hypothetical protein [Nitrospirota bacterium]
MIFKAKKAGLTWIAHAKETRKGLFSELDTLLKGMDKFFYSENLPFPQGRDPISVNFYTQLCIAGDVIFRVLGILETIMPEDRKNLYWFQKFAESRFLGEYKRNRYREDLLKQDTPEDSFYLLYDSFVHLKGLVSDLLKSDYIPYMSFLNFGRFITKEIRSNVYFNPFKKELNLTVDRIANAAITEITKKIDEKELRKQVSIIFLYFFRFLRYLNYVDISPQRAISFSTSILILILIRSEITSFRNYLDALKIKDEGLQFIIKGISYQSFIESKRVYMQELKDIFEKKGQELLKGKIENSFGILKNLFEQGIVQLAQYLHPDVRGEDIFESFTAKLTQSLKLREDVATLHFLITRFLNSASDIEERKRLFYSLHNFMQYFESFTFRLLRYDDYEEFAKFFEEISLFNELSVLEEQKIENLFKKMEYFKIFLETTIRHLNNRTELSNKPLDDERIRALASQYL